jgi:putative acetyltransferase
MLTLRTADNQDTDKILTLIEKVLREYGLDLDSDGVDSDLADIEANYTASGGWFAVIEDAAGRLVGTTGLLRVDDRVCELRKMYFGREIRGQGWGKSVLDLALARAEKMGFEEVRLETASVLVEAIGLYDRVGFRPVPGEACAVRCDRAYRLPLAEYRRPERLRNLNIER